MNTTTKTVTPATPLAKAMKLLLKNNISVLPVVNKGGTFLGVIMKEVLFRELVSEEDIESLTVEEMMSASVHCTVNERDSLEIAVNCMVDNNITSLPILSKGKVVGILTRSDVIKSLCSERNSINFALQAKDIMQKEVVTILNRATLREAAESMSKNNVSGLPVVDDYGVLVGVVSESDIIERPVLFDKMDHWIKLESFLHNNRISKDERYFEEINEYLDNPVKDVMTTRLIKVTLHTPLDEIAKLMVHKKINRVPVTDGEKLLGIITRGDILQAIQRTIKKR
jgi:CBS domain-containing protein